MAETPNIDDSINKRKSVWDFFKDLLPKPNTKKGKTLYDDSMAKGETEPLITQYDFEAISQIIQNAISDKDARNINLNHSALSSMDFAPIFNSKRSKINVYKQMYMYPEINTATSIIVNEAIVTDDQGDILKLIIKDNASDEMPIAVQEIFKASFDMMVIDIFDLDNVIEDLFTKFLIESELYIEYIMSEDGDAIVDYQVLPSYSMIPIFKDGTSTIIGYAQYEDIIINCDSDDEINNAFLGLGKKYDSVMGVDNAVWLDDKLYGVTEKSGYNEFLPNEIGYANFGSYGSSVYDVIGYYESVRKTYNQMSTIDDALAVYRFVRAPETRLWNIFTGSLPPGRADNYLQNVISEFRKDFNYDPQTGEIQQDTVFRSIIDDYFFATDGQGNKTTVDTLSGAMNLDQLNDLDYYKKKLMTGLHIPKGRWDPENPREWNARNDSVTSEEVQLSYFVERLRRNFVNIFVVCFENLLRLNGVDEKYIDKRYYKLEFANRNHWKFWQDNETLSAQLEQYKSMQELFYDPENNPAGILTPDWAKKKAFNLNAADELALEESLEEYKKTFENPIPKSDIETWEGGEKDSSLTFEYGSNKKIYDYGNEWDELPYQYGEMDEEEQKEYELYKFGLDVLNNEDEELEDWDDLVYDEEETYSEQELYHFGIDEVTYDYGHEESDEKPYEFGVPYTYGIKNELLNKHRENSHSSTLTPNDMDLYIFKDNNDEDTNDEEYVLYNFEQKDKEDKNPYMPKDNEFDKYDNSERTYEYGSNQLIDKYKFGEDEDELDKYKFGEDEDELF